MKYYFVLALCVVSVLGQMEISTDPIIAENNYKLPCIGPGAFGTLLELYDPNPGIQYIYIISLQPISLSPVIGNKYFAHIDSQNGVTDYTHIFDFPCSLADGHPYHFNITKYVTSVRKHVESIRTNYFHFIGCGLLTGECFKQPGCDDATCKCSSGYKPVAHGCAKENEVTVFHDRICSENGVRIFQEDLKNIQIRTRCNITVESPKVVVNRVTQLNTTALLTSNSPLEYDLENKDDEGVFPFFKASDGGIMLLPLHNESFINVPNNINASITSSTQGGETVRSATIKITGPSFLVWVIIVSIVVCILITIMIAIIIKKCKRCGNCSKCSGCCKKSSPKKTWELEGH